MSDVVSVADVSSVSDVAENLRAQKKEASEAFWWLEQATSGVLCGHGCTL